MCYIITFNLLAQFKFYLFFLLNIAFEDCDYIAFLPAFNGLSIVKSILFKSITT